MESQRSQFALKDEAKWKCGFFRSRKFERIQSRKKSVDSLNSDKGYIYSMRSEKNNVETVFADDDNE